MLSFQDLASMLSNFPQAKALFVAGCKRTDKEMLKSFYYSTGETTRGAEVSFFLFFWLTINDSNVYIIFLQTLLLNI